MEGQKESRRTLDDVMRHGIECGQFQLDVTECTSPTYIRRSFLRMDIKVQYGKDSDTGGIIPMPRSIQYSREHLDRRSPESRHLLLGLVSCTCWR